MVKCAKKMSEELGGKETKREELQTGCSGTGGEEAGTTGKGTALRVWDIGNVDKCCTLV